MGENGRKDVKAMFEGLTVGPGAAVQNGSSLPAGINGTHGASVVADVQIGFFLHTPFPSSEVFRCALSVSSPFHSTKSIDPCLPPYSTLPVRREILLGILNCDLIGFHTYDYARHFLSSVNRLLGFKCTPNSPFLSRLFFAFYLGTDSLFFSQ
jgi:trehalose 6-phosphate synthase